MCTSNPTPQPVATLRGSGLADKHVKVMCVCVSIEHCACVCVRGSVSFVCVCMSVSEWEGGYGHLHECECQHRKEAGAVTDVCKNEAYLIRVPWCANALGGRCDPA